MSKKPGVFTRMQLSRKNAKARKAEKVQSANFAPESIPPDYVLTAMQKAADEKKK